MTLRATSPGACEANMQPQTGPSDPKGRPWGHLRYMTLRLVPLGDAVLKGHLRTAFRDISLDLRVISIAPGLCDPYGPFV